MSMHGLRRGALPPFGPRRRVVVTGLGCVTPFGCTVEEMWSGLTGSASSARSLDLTPHFVPPFAEANRQAILDALPCRVACSVQTPSSLLGPKGQDPFAPTSAEPRYTRFARHAASTALRDAGLRVIEKKEGSSDENGNIHARRIGVNLGVGMITLSDVAEVGHQLYAQTAPKYNRISPYFVPKILGNMAACGIAIEHQLRGPNLSTVTACATGAHCIGDAARLIQLNHAEAMVCGAAEASITAIGIAGFARMRALSTKYNNNPEMASRPFDDDRDGFVMGEGAGVLVLEAEEHALSRGAKIYAELRGYGASGDAFHITSPREDGSGALETMLAALADGGVEPGEVDYINAHATSTPLGDSIEINAIESLLRNNRSGHPVSVSSNKGHIGHLLGAAGAVEAIATVLAVHRSVVPPTCNLHNPLKHDEALVRLVRGCSEARPQGIRAALSTSFGFGGTNSALLFSHY